MKLFSAAIAVSAFVSTTTIVVLVAIDRQLGVPVPYTVSCVAALLNAAGALAIALPRRTVVTPRLVARVARPVADPHCASRIAQAQTTSVDEAIVWFEAAGQAATEEAA